ncbi:MAG: uncharacterized protein K0S08_284 [Gammaproteobacteria bacterium]|jgi:translocation and assembly module TamB|nr:uncharacterized protein [Gammaproteobacteria bacterium]
MFLKKTLRIFLYFLVAVFAFLIASVSIVIYIGNSSHYSAWFIEKLAQKSSGKFSYTNYSGSLLQDFEIDGLVLHLKNQNVAVSKFHFTWQPLYLLKLNLTINNILLEGVRWDHFHKNDETTTPFSHERLNLPWWISSIAIKQLQVNQFYFHQKKLRLSLDNLRVQAFANHQQLQLQFTAQKFENISSRYSSIIAHHSINLSGLVKGPIAHYSWWLHVTPKDASSLEFSGDGTDSSLNLSHIEGKVWPKELQTFVQYQWHPFLAAEAKFSGVIDPRIWSKAYSGKLLLNLSFSGEHFDEASHHWQLDLKNISGKIQGRNIAGHGVITDQNQRLVWQDWHIQVAQSFMTLAGELSKNSDLKWDIFIPKLGYWFPKATGEIYSNGSLEGDLASPMLNGKLKILNLQIWALTIKNLLANANIASASQVFVINLQSGQLQWQTQKLDAITMQTQGTLAKHSIALELKHKLAKLVLNLEGSYKNDAWQGLLKALSIIPQNSLAWQLKQAVALDIGPHSFAMQDPLCLQQKQNAVCVKFDDSKNNKDFSLQTSKINLAFLQDFLGDKISLLHGDIKINADISFDHNWRPLGNIVFQSWPISFNYQVSATQSLPVQIQSSLWRININRLHALLTGNLKTNLGELEANVSLPQWMNYLASDWTNQPISGKLILRVSNISFLSGFFDVLSNVSGKLAATAEVAGSLQAPKIHLLAQLDQAAAHVIPYNLDLKNILIKLEGWSNEALKVTGSLMSDQGRLGFTGDINNLFSDPSLLLHLKGENVLLANLPSYKVWATPAMDMTLSATQFGLKGNLLIPKAQLQFADYENKAITLTDDIVYEDEEQKRFSFNSNIFLQLGDDVKLRYGGLTGQLKGKLQLQQTTDAPATAIGAIHLVDGKYKAYGQTLIIQRGSASFKGGNVNNPVLDVQAVKVLQNVTPLTADGAIAPGASLVGPDGSLTVGVSITGPLAQRKTELFSIPAGLSQSDILSYLVLGVPASQAGSGGGQLLLSAASSLSDGKSGGAISQLQEQLKNGLGIEVGVGTVSQYNPTTQSVTEGTALILTKSLSPKLFFTYSAGTGQTVSVFKIRYQISPKWMAQTESSALGNGGDIYYMISRD